MLLYQVWFISLGGLVLSEEKGKSRGSGGEVMEAYWEEEREGGCGWNVSYERRIINKIMHK